VVVGQILRPATCRKLAIFVLVFRVDPFVLSRHVPQIRLRASVKFQTSGYLQVDFGQILLRGLETFLRIK
jgi:hypothetical protein